MRAATKISTARNRFGRTKLCERDEVKLFLSNKFQNDGRDKAKLFFVKYVPKQCRIQGTENMSHPLQHWDFYEKLI